MPSAQSHPGHVVRFYEESDFPDRWVADFVWAGILASESFVLIATPVHCVAVEDRLATLGATLADLERSGRIAILDARTLLDDFMALGIPDRQRFHTRIRSVLEKAAAAAPSGRVRVYGELVALLAAEGNVTASMIVERFWHELLSESPFLLACAYPIQHFAHESHAESFRQVCDIHDEVIPVLTWLEEPERHTRSIAVLQQEAYALQVELAERRRTEAHLGCLAQLSRVLVSSLDHEKVLASVLALTLPVLGDIGILEVLDQRGGRWRLTRAYEDPQAEALLVGTEWLSSRLEEQCPPAWATPALRPIIDDTWLQRVAAGPEELVLVRQLAICSMLSVPLAFNGYILGRLTVFYGRSGRQHDQRDLDLAQEIASRAALSLDNARLYRERAETLRLLADADRRKDEFLAMLGHELRNPLAPILTAVQLMELHGDSQTARERGVIRRQVEHLTRLVDDLLDVARITRGKIVLRMERSEISTVVAKAVEIVSPLIAQRAQQLSINVPVTGLAVLCDVQRLAQVFANLLINAAKYTNRQGCLTITAGHHGEQLAIAVADSGCGIPKEMLEHIFDIFVQADRPCDSAPGGLGLGLALVKTLTELHGGTVSAESAGAGQGSTFTVRLPALPNRQVLTPSG